MHIQTTFRPLKKEVCTFSVILYGNSFVAHNIWQCQNEHIDYHECNALKCLNFRLWRRDGDGDDYDEMTNKTATTIIIWKSQYRMSDTFLEFSNRFSAEENASIQLQTLEKKISSFLSMRISNTT